MVNGPERRMWTLQHTGPRLSANVRLHHQQKAQLDALWRGIGKRLAQAAKIPPLGRAHVLVEWRPRDNRRRDPANLAPLAKAFVDGLVDAKVLPDDDAGHLDGPDCRLGEPVPNPSPWLKDTVTVRVTVTEQPASGPPDAGARAGVSTPPRGPRPPRRGR